MLVRFSFACICHATTLCRWTTEDALKSFEVFASMADSKLPAGQLETKRAFLAISKHCINRRFKQRIRMDEVSESR